MPKPTDKAKVTWLLPRALYEEARSAALVTSEAGGSPTLSALFEEALAGCGKSDLGTDRTATDHEICSSGAGTSGANMVIREDFVVSQNRFSAAC